MTLFDCATNAASRDGVLQPPSARHNALTTKVFIIIAPAKVRERLQCIGRAQPPTT